MAQARAKVLEEQRAKNQMKGLSKESAIGMKILLTFFVCNRNEI